MATSIKVSFLTANSATWAEDVNRLRSQLGSPNNSYLFPPHFLKTTFPNNGGQIVICEREQRCVGIGFLFPRGLRAGTRELTLRFHKMDKDFEIDPQQLTSNIEVLLGEARVVFYDPTTEQRYEKTSYEVNGVDIGSPDAAEAAAIRRLQQQIWRSESDFLYPADIHSSGFRAGTSLIARIEGEPAGFLFGFYKFDGPPLPGSWHWTYQSDFRIESQLMGVLPEHRGREIGFLLKKLQAENARQEGIDVINWTADPLQFGNAVLNFGKLKAVALDFYPDYYPFRNALNQITASRVAITWLINTPRVTHALTDTSRADIVSSSGHDSIRKVNQGWAEFHFDEDAQMIAIEVPANWTTLQQEDFQQALRWRETTDSLFRHYLGREEGKYMITGVGQEDDRRYLVAERVEPALLERLST